MNKERSESSAVGIIAVVVALLLALPCLLVVVGGLGYFWLSVRSAAPPPVIAPAPVVVPQPTPVPDPAPLPEAEPAPE